ncbi:MAG: Demethylrebeccamycin-D-glucose O-methyltransferase [Chlamydiae bacterium]|nr:Demethylrebeccamycin-D-glucose O-methyltransferase [Chlamydiota bacterium]
MSSNTSLVSEAEKKCMEIVSIEKLYDEHDLSKWPLFSGGFINFGYWEGINTHNKISTEERLESERNLYRCVLKKLDISSRDNILEVACGLGLGCSLLMKEFPVQKITGIDISLAQIKRAKKHNKKLLSSSQKLKFQIGKAENIPFKDACFSKLFSIEAIQHFLSVYNFANEAFRVIKPKGRLAIASFFATTLILLQKLKK